MPDITREQFLEAALWLNSAGQMAMVAARSPYEAHRDAAAQHVLADLQKALAMMGLEAVRRHAGHSESRRAPSPLEAAVSSLLTSLHAFKGAPVLPGTKLNEVLINGNSAYFVEEKHIEAVRAAMPADMIGGPR